MILVVVVVVASEGRCSGRWRVRTVMQTTEGDKWSVGYGTSMAIRATRTETTGPRRPRTTAVTTLAVAVDAVCCCAVVDSAVEMLVECVYWALPLSMPVVFP